MKIKTCITKKSLKKMFRIDKWRENILKERFMREMDNKYGEGKINKIWRETFRGTKLYQNGRVIVIK